MNRRSILRGIIAAIVAPRELLSAAVKPDPDSGYWEYTFGSNADPVWRSFTVNEANALDTPKRYVEISLQPGKMICFGDYAREEITFHLSPWKDK